MHNQKSKITLAVIVLIAFTLMLPGCGENAKSFLDDIDISDEATTASFVESFKQVDYKNAYDEKTWKFSAINDSVFVTEEQIAITLYALNEIQPEEAGYICACVEETAWNFRSGIVDGVLCIYSGYQGEENVYNHSVYTFYFSVNTVSNENDISVGPGPVMVHEFKGHSDLEKWENEQRKATFDSYQECMTHFNGETQLEESQQIFGTYQVGDVVEIKGFIEHTWRDFPTWCLGMTNSIDVYDDGGANPGTITTNQIFFFDEDSLDGKTFEECSDGVTLYTIRGTLINYRDGGEIFITEPSIVEAE